MRHRSLGVIALAFGAVMLALYSQIAAIALILSGSIFATLGSLPAAAALILGAVFLGLTLVAYGVGFGLWTGKPWAWVAANAAFGVFIVANLVLSLVAGSFASALVTTVAAGVVLWYLRRPAVRTELLTGARPTAPIVMAEGPELPRPVH